VDPNRVLRHDLQGAAVENADPAADEHPLAGDVKITPT